MQLFFALKSDVQQGVLSTEESQHCVKVLRKKEGDQVHVIDGEGGRYLVEITKANSKKCQYQLISKEETECTLPNLHVAIAPTRHLSRFEFFLEKACELGIKEITPMLTHNCERKHLNVEKLTKKMIAACKQSYTLHFPVINPVTSFSDLVKQKADQKLVAHCHSHTTPHLASFEHDRQTLLLIGPEGDFSNAEVELAVKQNFEAVSLGPKRLRTETAGMFACAVFNLASA